MIKEENYKKAVYWIVKLLNKNRVKFHFIGGLAAYAYGSKIRYNDIDLAMNLKDMNKLVEIAKDYVIEKPWNGTSSNKIWKGYVMRLEYYRIKIDVTEAKFTKIFNKKSRKYEKFPSDLQNPTFKKIFGLNVPIMQKNKLIKYKSKLKFPNDLIDLKYLK